jgi:hypothetical protein
VVVGVGFAVFETRRYRRERNREAAIVLLQAFQTPDFAKALGLVYRLPDGLSKTEIEDRLGADLHIVYAMTATWESIGILVYRREVDIDLVDDFFSGPIVVSWRKLQGYFFGEREATGRKTIGEWFQWLADQFARLESSSAPVPAHIQYRDWTPDRPA